MTQNGAVLIAGGTGGIGSAICEEFVRFGLPVVFTYHNNQAKADELKARLEAQGITAEAHRLDLTDAEATAHLVEAVATQHGGISNVIYAAGPNFEMAFVSQLKPKNWSDVFAADVNGCFNLFNAVLQQFRKQRSGNIIALTTCALKRPPKADVLSAAPKAAIDMLVKCIAKEEGRYGIRANCVEIGFIAAGITAHYMQHVWAPELVEGIKKDTPLRRFGTGTEIAKAVAFLCSEDAAFITGQALAVDGGFQL